MRMKKLLQFVLVSSLVASSCSSFAAHAVRADKAERAKPKFPVGCHPVGHQFFGQEMILRPVPQMSTSHTPFIQTVYLVHNLSNQNLQLKDPDAVGNDLTIPTYKTEIGAGKWSAFSMNEKEIKFSCESLSGPFTHGGLSAPDDPAANSDQDANNDQDVKDGQATHRDQVASDPVSCQESLEVCQYVRAKFGGHNGGSYWITKGGDQHQAVEETIHSGILLR